MDVPAKQTAELIKSGAVDIFLTVAGYGVGKVAPKISKTSKQIAEKAGQFGDDIANAANKARVKSAELIDDFNEGLQKLGKTLIPETELATPNGAKFDPSELRARKTPLEKINDPMEARANENLSDVKKAVNLPSWNKLTLKLDKDGTPHIFSGHRKGGNRLKQSVEAGGQKDVFPDWMSEKQILNSTKQAYGNAKKVGTQVNGVTGEKRVELVGYSDDGMKIRMYVNVTTNELESAFPQWK